jgi:hypothetical protein
MVFSHKNTTGRWRFGAIDASGSIGSFIHEKDCPA